MSEEILATDWVQILVTFRSTCYHCGKEVPPGKAFWSNSAKAALHLRCKHTKDESVITKENPSIETAVLHNVNDEPVASGIHSPKIIELQCYVCGGKTGCQECSFLSKCALRFNSGEYCICVACASNSAGAETYEKYKRIFLQNVKSEMNI
ncbi:MAG: hypothetical protein M3P08_14160 [Thermoproteota archaeon]|nr:hypothetical protein [Thermoproteota archaeon]